MISHTNLYGSSGAVTCSPNLIPAINNSTPGTDETLQLPNGTNSSVIYMHVIPHWILVITLKTFIFLHLFEDYDTTA